MKKLQERHGAIFVLLSTFTWVLFPILAYSATRIMPPLWFAALSAWVAAVLLFIYFAAKGQWQELGKREAYFPIAQVTLCIVVIPYALFNVGSSLTTGVNSSLLLLSEIIFTLILTHWYGEKTTWLKVAGSGAVLLGLIGLLYEPGQSISVGDMLIILSTSTYPIGNFYNKRALTYTTPAMILMSRFVLGAGLLTIIALLWSDPLTMQHIGGTWWMIMLNGFVVLSIGKLLFYEGLKRLDITKAITLGSVAPALSALYFLIFTSEALLWYQFIGMAILTLGLWLTFRRKSASIERTRYGKHLQ